MSQQKVKKISSDFVLVIHGGAGTIVKENMTPEKEQAYIQKMTEALQAGYQVLRDSGTSVQAVEAAIKVMEDSPLFNAGKGSVYTSEETNEMDAAVMDGASGKAGAVAGVKSIKNPITAARFVMQKSEHVMLVGRGAEQFAEENGCMMVDSSYFFDQQRLDQLRKIREKEKEKMKPSMDGGALTDTSAIRRIDYPDEKFGTVGAVALDCYGNLAAGTSTGGMTNKRYGRVGDAPIIGAGTYANNESCAVSCTGHGEYFMRNVVAYDVAAQMIYRKSSLEKAAEYTIMKKLESQGGKGGLIALDRKGNYTMVFNTAGMYRGVIHADGKIEVLIFK